MLEKEAGEDSQTRQPRSVRYSRLASLHRTKDHALEMRPHSEPLGTVAADARTVGRLRLRLRVLQDVAELWVAHHELLWGVDRLALEKRCEL